MTIIAIKDKHWQAKDQYTKTMLLNIRSIYRQLHVYILSKIVRKPKLKNIPFTILTKNTLYLESCKLCNPIKKYYKISLVKVTQSYLTLCYPTDYTVPWNSPGQNTGVGSFSLLQGIFPTQKANPGLPHCRRFFTSWATREAQEYWSG